MILSIRVLSKGDSCSPGHINTTIETCPIRLSHYVSRQCITLPQGSAHCNGRHPLPLTQHPEPAINRSWLLKQTYAM